MNSSHFAGSIDRCDSVRVRRSVRLCWLHYAFFWLQWSRIADELSELTRSIAELCGNGIFDDKWCGNDDRLPVAARRCLFHSGCGESFLCLFVVSDSDLVLSFCWLLQNTIDEWSKVFFVGATIYIVPSLLFMLMGSAEIQPWNDCNPHGHESTMVDVSRALESRSAEQLQVLTKEVEKVDGKIK